MTQVGFNQVGWEFKQGEEQNRMKNLKHPPTKNGGTFEFGRKLN